MTRRRRIVLAASVLLLAAAAYIGFHVATTGPRSTYVPRDAALRAAMYHFYPAEGTPRAIVVFFGNDVGFWKPHEELAWRMSRDGLDAVGIEIRPWLGSLPSREPQRDSAVRATAAPLVERVRHELHADSLPIVLAGHSFGAEVAIWIAHEQPPAHLAGVLALSPRATGHLWISPLDLANHEASGPWAFSTVAMAGSLAPAVRVAIVRGDHDPFIRHDSAFAAAGGPRLRVYHVPFAGHSLQKLLIAGPIVSHALEFVLGN